MARKDEKYLRTVSDEELSTVAGGSGTFEPPPGSPEGTIAVGSGGSGVNNVGDGAMSNDGGGYPPPRSPRWSDRVASSVRWGPRPAP
jgi:hypothetical protein